MRGRRRRGRGRRYPNISLMFVMCDLCFVKQYEVEKEVGEDAHVDIGPTGAADAGVTASEQELREAVELAQEMHEMVNYHPGQSPARIERVDLEKD